MKLSTSKSFLKNILGVQTFFEERIWVQHLLILHNFEFAEIFSKIEKFRDFLNFDHQIFKGI